MKIYVDVSETVNNQLRTGIQRVVREVIRHSVTVGKKLDVEVIPVVAYKKNFYQLNDLNLLFPLSVTTQKLNADKKYSSTRPIFIRAIKQCLKCIPIFYPLAIKIWGDYKRRCNIPSLYKSINPENDDILLLLDSFWSGLGTLPAAKAFRKNNGVVITVIYDVIPMLYPQYCDEILVPAYKRAFYHIIEISDAILGISKAVTNDVELILSEKNKNQLVNIPLNYFYLGADFSDEEIGKVSNVDWEVDFWEEEPVFLMVGTIEPRKGHEFVLDAFERRWNKGETNKLLILGKVGWKTEVLINRILNSPYYGKRLLMVNQASDADLKNAYHRAYACIIASYAEGFGLPLIEAQHYGVPVIASDIPVFKEISEDHVIFFSLQDLTSFDKAIETLKKNYNNTKEKVNNFKWLTWQESTEQLLSNVKSFKSGWHVAKDTYD